IYLYKVFKDDPILGLDLDTDEKQRNFWNDFFIAEGMDPDSPIGGGDPALLTDIDNVWEYWHRILAGLITPRAYNRNLRNGRRQILAFWDTEAVHPQTGAFGAFGDKAKEAMVKVYTSNERLIKLIDDLLNISRIERGKMDYDFQVLPLEKLVGDVILELKPVAERKGLKINWQEPVGLPKIKFDESKMRQVVLNLIDNAVKYTEKGEIDAKLEKINGKIRLTIKDTGAGLAKEKIPLLFKKYSRVETKSPYGKHTQGMGLGLYVAKRIIDDHKGKIWAESEGEGKGSAFFVELPAD
ncbi:MAG: PAS/PAC sensor signal transduction histidine kinase, partial [Parcubacteria group bacterium GW2011_GWB1_41_6]